MFDPDLYRDKSEIEHWRERDPILQLTAMLRDREMLDDRTLAEIESRAAAEIEAAVEFAEAGSLEPVDHLGNHVYRRVVDR